MFNVDTISLGINLYDIGCKITSNNTTQHIYHMDNKIKSKLYLDDENRLKLSKLKNSRSRYIIYSSLDCIYRFGRDNGYSFCYNETRKSLTVTLLHYNVEQYTAEEIIKQSREKVIEYFELEATEFPDLKLRRIDYYCDYRYRDSQEYAIIKSIIATATTSFYSYSKEIEDTDEKYVVKYLGRKCNAQEYRKTKLSIENKKVIDIEAMLDDDDTINKCSSDTTSRNLEVCIYDKAKETKERLATGRANQDELIYYKGVIRTEVKVKNGKLNSNKSYDIGNNKTLTRIKELDVYYNRNSFDYYYSRTVAKIFGTEPFYRIDIALDIINNSDELTKNIKLKLCNLLQLINSKGYTDAKKYWESTYSISTFKTHIKKIRGLGLNPLTFNLKINDVDIDYETIPNFTLLDNAEMEFIKAHKQLF